MAQRNVTVGVAANLTAILTLSATGLPATGLVAADLTCEYRKATGIFTAKALAGLVTELGHGAYSIQFTAAELSEIGQFLWVLTGATIAQFTGDAAVVAASVTPTSAELLTCVMTGNVFGLDGSPLGGASVIARPAGQPTLQGNVGVANGTVSVATDATGFFAISLPRLVMCDVTIPAMGYQARVTVPNSASADLFTS